MGLLDVFDVDTEDALLADSNGKITQVSPSSLRLTTDAVRSGEKWVKTMFVAGLPASPGPRVIQELTSHSNANVDFTMRVEPMNPNSIRRKVKQEIRDTRINIGNAKRTNDDAKLQDYEENMKRLLTVLAAVENDSEEIVRCGIYISIRHESLASCERAEEDIRRSMSRKNVTMKTVHWNTDRGIQTVAPMPHNPLGDRYMNVMTGSAVGMLYPFTSNTIVEESGILYGRNAQNNDPVKIDRYQRNNGYNMVVTGDIGAGKSYMVSLLDLRERINDPDLTTIIVDPRGSFHEVCEAMGGDKIVVGGSTPLNPLEIVRTPQNVLDRVGDLSPFAQTLDSRIGFFETFLNRGDDDGLTTIRRTVLREALVTTYNRAGIYEHDYDSHARDSPTVPNLKDTLRDIENDVEEFLGRDESDRTIENWEEAANYIRNALESFRTAEYCADHSAVDDRATIDACSECVSPGSYANLAQRSEFSMVNSNFIYIDMQQFEGSRDSSIMMKLIWDAIYNRTKLSDGHVHTVIDEFHTILENEGDLDWLENEYRHSRHFDNGITVMSQRSKDFFRQEKAETIVELSSMSLSMKNENMSIEHGSKLGFTEEEINFIRKCKAGDKDRGWSNALVKVGDQAPIPLIVDAMPSEEKLIDPETWAYHHAPG